ncbi:hypothetical protein LTR96_011115 [Exophiala xenobiotica]|nr:hypothetical protein LTR41_011270 [Exophiala xenobiotica]KAK5215776.1 hypothetical protein LTR72_011190 [Exophiala xenobiotica]KAK5220889.1 hypothetical protein LTR47_011045 [Exophiala xenobiotica]KAK5245532.1 hypothetical protein LTS06_009054 [Exophiala xenobiotica]KAK5263481.1 hypothetical protein LTR96_011115 [Exophiala xenobiotica]
MKWPGFDELPLDNSGPPGNAWGLFGKDDQLGRLNLLTPDTVKAAASEIQQGIRVSLDWPIDKPTFPAFKRPRFQHQLINLAPRAINDDMLTFNTQCSTQWDGFRHYAYQETKQFYNGNTQQEIDNGGALGIDAWSKAGGIVGRGILLDWCGWSQRNNKAKDPFVSGAIEFADLLQMIKEQNIEIKPGDVMFLRTGFVASYNKFSTAEQEEFSQQSNGYLGFEANRASLKWLWDSGFAAVVSDSPSFERSPIAGAHNEPGVSVHQWGLAGWGMPIGEMFDLEELAEQCAKLQRYSFFVSSMPLKVPHGVASPPCAVAIF